MSLIVKKAGICDSFQDLGRHGFAAIGVNPNGAMDKTALRTANILLGNPESLAALEMHVPAPVLEFRAPVSFVLSGTVSGAELDGKPVRELKPFDAGERSVLSFKNRGSGGKSYLQVKNGFNLDNFMDSDSTNLIAGFGGLKGRRLSEGDAIEFRDPEIVHNSLIAGNMRQTGSSKTARLRFVPGPAYCDLTAKSALGFLKSKYLVLPSSNRMGYRLKGEPLHTLLDDERVSSAVTYGTIQLLPDNQLIVLMADHQTTGGYPNLGTVIGSDLSKAAQSSPGHFFAFVPVSHSTAESILLQLEKDFAFLRTGVRLFAG